MNLNEPIPTGQNINLADIVFPDDNHPYDAGRVLEFWLHPEQDLVSLAEGCDQYYGVDLNASQVDLLIAFLQRLRSQMVES